MFCIRIDYAPQELDLVSYCVGCGHWRDRRRTSATHAARIRPSTWRNQLVSGFHLVQIWAPSSEAHPESCARAPFGAKAGAVADSRRLPTCRRRRNCDSSSHPGIFPSVFAVVRGYPGCHQSLVPGSKRFVYVLQSGDSPPHFYVGLTSNVAAPVADQPLRAQRQTKAVETRRCHRVQRRTHGYPLRTLPKVRLGPRLLRTATSSRKPLRPFDQLPVGPRPQDSQRPKARNGESGCARCCGVALGTRPDKTTR